MSKWNLNSSVSFVAFSVSLAALSIALTQPAMAQVSPDDSSNETAESERGLSTVFVTAQRREESAQDVPIAISAFSAEELENRGIANTLEVTQFVPNLVGLNNTGLGTANAYFLRGIGNSESIATFDPPIGTYIDDIYISRQNANNLSFFDVNRVEVLRGPQGTLFGRNTTGGAVSVFLNEPSDELTGYAEVGYGSFDRTLVRGSINIPLHERFAVTLSGYWQNDDGYVQNTVTDERTNEDDGWGVRVGVRGELTDWATWKGSYIHTDSEASNLLNFDCDPNDPSNCDGRFSATGLQSEGTFNTAAFGPLLTGDKNDFGLGNSTTLDFFSSNFEIELGQDWTVNFITGYVDISQEFALDFADGRGLPSAATPVPPVIGFTNGGFTIANDSTHEQFTQEIKFNGSVGNGFLDLVGGVYYFTEDNVTDFGDIFSLPIPPFPLPDGFPLLLADRTLVNDTEAWAGYIQGDAHVTDRLTLTAGIRYTDEEKTFDISDNRAAIGGGLCAAPTQFGPSPCLENANLIAPNGEPIPTEQSVGIFTPRFAVNYAATDDVLLFASATRGFKSGGWNARGTAPSELLPFGPERAWSYEAGAKSELFGNLLRVNLTAFYLDVEDLQTPAAVIRPDNSLGFITRNFADFENKGIELEITAAPIEGLNLFGAVGYQDDNYNIDSNAPEFDEFGVQSVAAQQADCLAQLAAGLLPNSPNMFTGDADNATSCGVGIVNPDGSIAEPVRTPEFTIALGGSYNYDFGDYTITPSFNANWRSDSEVGIEGVTLFDQALTGPVTGEVFPANTLGLGEPIDPPTGSFSEDRWIVNASVTLSHIAGVSFVAECKNCFDEESVESALANFSYLNPPRTWTLRAKYEF